MYNRLYDIGRIIYSFDKFHVLETYGRCTSWVQWVWLCINNTWSNGFLSNIGIFASIKRGEEIRKNEFFYTPPQIFGPRYQYKITIFKNINYEKIRNLRLAYTHTISKTYNSINFVISKISNVWGPGNSFRKKRRWNDESLLKHIRVRFEQHPAIQNR